jgi:hypothetical protein
MAMAVMMRETAHGVGPIAEENEQSHENDAFATVSP